jgi:hypothetical protein
MATLVRDGALKIERLGVKKTEASGYPIRPCRVPICNSHALFRVSICDYPAEFPNDFGYYCERHTQAFEVAWDMNSSRERVAA